VATSLSTPKFGTAPPVSFWKRFHYVRTIPFFLIHASCLAVFFVPLRWKWVALMVALYAVRMFVVTAGYHRYFSHRSFKLNRFWQFVLAFAAETSCQKGILWWAANHRHHHRYADQEEDVHSPGLHGIWWSHVGWILSHEYDRYDRRMIKDFGKYPELRWIDRFHWIPPIVLAGALLALGGWPAFVWGFLVSTVLLFHGTFCINSLSHLWGTRRFDTPDHSRNNFTLAVITLGEGWHNNHHRHMYACRQGMRWWEIDVTYYALWCLGRIGIVHELRGFRLPTDATPEEVG
jgi:stearoyl-CoA desaturase (delta-9 desaturase)